MLIFRYNKLGNSAFISHLDTLRVLIRTLRRSKIPVKYSKGFNPHMNIYMTSPLVLGTESQAEYCFVDTDLKADEFKDLFNSKCIKGMECTEVYNVKENPNLAGKTVSALYDIKNKYLKDNIQEIQGLKQINVTIEKRGISIQDDIKSDILKLEKTKDGITALLKFGNNGNLRVDRFLQAFNLQQDKNCTVFKKEIFCNKGNKDITIKEFLLDFII